MNITQIRRKNKQLGQGMTEYIIIVALIAVSAISVYTMFGKTLRNQTAGLAHEMAGQPSAPDISNAGTNSDQATTNSQVTKNMGTYNANNGDK